MEDERATLPRPRHDDSVCFKDKHNFDNFLIKIPLCLPNTSEAKWAYKYMYERNQQL